MITCRPRLNLAKRAIACFERQTYPFRELVIISEDDVAELADYVPPNGAPAQPGAKPDIRRTFFQAPKGLTLGDLRNLSIGRAKGYFITTWDDDDIHADARLARQMAMLKQHPEADGCGLSRITIAWKSRDLFAISKSRPAWENTILARRWQIPCYPALKRGSDTPVVESMKVVSLDAPDLYVYNIHDSNTWPAHHFESMFKHASETLAPAAADMVRTSLGNVDLVV
jgi:glycosyltransferase involved in cell wall biosynthesis